MKEMTLQQALEQRAYLLDILEEIADASICFESVRKAQQAIQRVKHDE
jgi:hypothetical protein